MSGSYNAALDAMVAAIQAVATTRIVTRTLVDLDQHQAADLQAGIFIVIADGVRGYPYEHSDYHNGVDAPSQTELGQFEFIVIGRGQLPEGSDGAAVEAAEFAMLAELEAVADAAIGSDPLLDLLLLRSELSGQLVAPYCTVYTRWRLRLFN